MRKRLPSKKPEIKQGTMRLLLFHGRVTPNERLHDWGDPGPDIVGIVAVHVTYRGDPIIYFESVEAAHVAHKITGWEKCDSHALEMRFCNDLLEIKEQPEISPGQPDVRYFGDYEFQTVEP